MVRFFVCQKRKYFFFDVVFCGLKISSVSLCGLYCVLSGVLIYYYYNFFFYGIVGQSICEG